MRHRSASGSSALEVLDTLGIPSESLPPVISSADVAGRITGEVAEATGLPAGTLVVGGGADNACAAIGNGVIDDGLALVSVG